MVLILFQESWLKQVQEMQLHCENGLKFVSSGASSHLNLTHDSRFVNFSKLLTYSIQFILQITFIGCTVHSLMVILTLDT